jgi:hypothetical protein
MFELQVSVNNYFVHLLVEHTGKSHTDVYDDRHLLQYGAMYFVACRYQRFRSVYTCTYVPF